MDHQASAAVDTEGVANNVASWVQSLSMGDNALDGDAHMVVMTLVCLVFGVVLTGMWVSLCCCRHCFFHVAGDAFVNIANDVTTMPQSLDAADVGNKRYHILQTKHKIFLSHSGAQKSFVADLCIDLKRRDRHPFFDRSRSSLPIGDKFPNLIFDAIKQCKVGVVVLSEEFFTSKWPMLELVAMVEESKKPNRRIQIIPVFYSISRDKCCDRTIQAKWMTKYWKKWEKEDKKRIDLKKWKNALGIFGSTTGLVMKDGMLDGELRVEIVEAICKKVLPETRWDDSGVKGKRRLCQEIRKKVYKGLQPKDFKGGVQVWGMYGIGGIGKTTACKVLCNDMSTDYYDKVCHVEWGSLSEVELLQKILKTFSDLDGEILDKISDVGVGYGYLKSHVVKKRVFLALDNVSDESKEQAKSYVQANFGDGSVVLVTARSVDQLQYLGVHKDNCFPMLELELEEAKSLFLSYTRLRKNEVDQELLEKCIKRCYFSKGQLSSCDVELEEAKSLFLSYTRLRKNEVDQELLEKCVKRCYFSKGQLSSSDGMHYHPLALRVLGCEVGDLARQYGMTRQVALLTRINTFNLSRQKEHPVFSILRSSFDSLLEEDQLFFLHIALFLPDYPIQNRVKTLCSWMDWLSMVHGEKDNDIELRLECLKRKSLLESFGEEVEDFRMHDLWREFAAAEIKGGRLKDQYFLCESEECSGRVDLRKFPKMRVVKLMDVEGDVALDVRGLMHLQSLEVVLEDWATSVREVKGLGTLEDLTYLRCEGIASTACIAELVWLTNLQVVELVGFQGDKLPDMSKLTNLRILDLQHSKSLQSIKLRNHTNLTYLAILGCDSLQSVDISGCTSMEELWDFNLAISIEELNVSSCPNLQCLFGLWRLKKLRKLDITGCSSIRKLDGLRDLAELEELRAMHCERLAVLPSCRLPKLRVLEIEPSKVPAQTSIDSFSGIRGRRFGTRVRRFRTRGR